MTGAAADSSLMGAREIADRMGLSRQRVQQLAERPDFPAPVALLRMGRVWRTTEIESWLRIYRDFEERK
ncbi:helix-turn-helix transcriptional regulator [Actinoplanes awajinensis]|nr:AlpA family phage regulatory protein [Actinoplanes awajinensis]